MAFSFKKTSLEGLVLIQPHCHQDERGYFIKDFEKDEFIKNGIRFDLYESFESMSRKGTLRGLHFQTKHPQGKLIRVTQGAVFDVAVDLRLDSATLGQWEGFYLNAQNHAMIYIPAGFAHGFLALEDDTVMVYKCNDKYSEPHDTGILWRDRELSIDWPLHLIGEDLIISERDLNHPSFKGYLKGLTQDK